MKVMIFLRPVIFVFYLFIFFLDFFFFFVFSVWIFVGGRSGSQSAWFWIHRIYFGVSFCDFFFFFWGICVLFLVLLKCMLESTLPCLVVEKMKGRKGKERKSLIAYEWFFIVWNPRGNESFHGWGDCIYFA